MPKLELHYNPEFELFAKKLSEALPNIVAPNLNIPGGEVTPKDIIVKCIPIGENDKNTKDIEIYIFAHDFPERKANLEERNKAVITGVQKFKDKFFKGNSIKKPSGFVWTLLMPTAFDNF